MLDHKNKIVFIHNMKSCGTAVENALKKVWCKMFPNDDLWPLEFYHRYYPETLGYTPVTVIRNSVEPSGQLASVD